MILQFRKRNEQATVPEEVLSQRAPPDACKISPVSHREASEARNAEILAMSSVLLSTKLDFDSSRSVSIAPYRSRSQFLADVERLNTWDNGNSNVWSLPLKPLLSRFYAQR